MSNDQKIDIIGERFVYENYVRLFSYMIMRCKWNKWVPEMRGAEGADLEICIQDTYQDDMAFTDDEIADLEAITKTHFEREKIFLFGNIIKGPVEVKTSRFNQYISFNNYKVDKYGALPFAIWNSNNHEGREERKRTRLGSLYRMFYPNNIEHERYPLAYVAVLLNKEEEPYACLVFEDFYSLKKRLMEIGHRCGLDLSKEGFEKIPCWEKEAELGSPDEWAKNKMSENRNLLLMANMWYVRMPEVIDLAKVILIGDAPDIPDRDSQCSIETQRARWKYLKSKARESIPVSIDRKTKCKKALRESIFSIMTMFPLKVDETTGNQEKSMEELMNRSKYSRKRP